MDVKALRDTIEELKKDLGPGLLAMDVYARADGQSLAGFNSNPKACALFNRVTGNIATTLESAKFPELDRYYMLDLMDDKLAIVIPIGDHQWQMLVNKTEIQLGLLLNILLPKVMSQDIFGPVKSKGKSSPKEESKPVSEPAGEPVNEADMMPDELSEEEKGSAKKTEPDVEDDRCTIDFS